MERDTEEEPEIWEVETVETMPDPTKWAQIVRIMAYNDDGQRIAIQLHIDNNVTETFRGMFLENVVKYDVAGQIKAEVKKVRGKDAVVFWKDGKVVKQ